jgi:hypothetical protein
LSIGEENHRDSLHRIPAGSLRMSHVRTSLVSLSAMNHKFGTKT